jgi:uncharacterized coiled-coil protein SlyX
MLSLLYRFASWLAQKIGVALLVVILALGAYAFWLFARDDVDFDTHRLERLRVLSAEQKHLQEGLSGVNRRIADLQADLAAQQERLHLAERVTATLRADDTWWRTLWDKLFGDAAEVHTKEERLARLEKTQAEATTRSAELRTAITRATWERDGVEIALGRVDKRLADVERNSSKVLHYLDRAWMKTRWYVIAALVAWFLGPALWRQWRRRDKVCNDS